MALSAYGLLVGKITGFRAPQGHQPHWLLLVQPSDAHHPPYRVALNVPAAQPKDHSEIEYHLVDLKPQLSLLQKLRRFQKAGGTHSFLLAAENRAVPRLDYTAGDLAKLLAFPSEVHKRPKVGDKGLAQNLKPLHVALTAALKSNAMVAVFGTGYPADHRTGALPPTGFTGIDNVHMNQGAFNRTNGTLHYMENGPEQDGGLIVLDPKGAKGIFIKFRSQTVQTDAHGHPTVTGIRQIDAVPDRIRKSIMPAIPGEPKATPRPRAAGAAVTPTTVGQAPGTQNGKGYVFADFDQADASGSFIPDNDGTARNSPSVLQQSKGTTRGPVPVPRAYPLMDLASVVGASQQGCTNDSSGHSIAFDVIGDSGAPTQQKLAGYESKVADLLAQDAVAAPPAFMFHVGDVVYFYGEKAYYYSQFYDPFRAYPAPIFAIPGNHDGITYDASIVSLADFQSAFCAPTPGRVAGAGGILRSAMTQPGVYFTLEAQGLVSIIGLYSNCGESLGWLDSSQLQFLYQELVRLKAKRKNGLPAVILAIHHFPRWFPAKSKSAQDPNSAALDATFAKAGFWPDAVICGHAHLYQRVVRQKAGLRNRQDIPYVMSGAGGYGITPSEEVAKAYMQQLGVSAGKASALGCIVNESGYVRATVTNPTRGNPTLGFEYRSVKPASSQPDDSCTIDLVAGSLVS